MCNPRGTLELVQYMCVWLCVCVSAPTQHEVEHHKDVLPILEGKPQIDQEWMLQCLEYVNLTENILYSVFLDDLNLIHVLHGVHLFSISFLDNTNLQVNGGGRERMV